MIRLKDLLREQSEPKTLRVLFVGDSQTKSAESYARNLLKSKNIRGKIVVKPNATTADLLNMIENNISDEYDVVSVFVGNADSANPNENAVISNFKQIENIVKQYNVKLVVITPPTTDYIQSGDAAYKKGGYPSNEKIADWLSRRSKADVIINTQDLDFQEIDFDRNHATLDKDAQLKIADIWQSEIQQVTGIEVKSEPEAEIEDDEVDTIHRQLIDKGINVSKQAIKTGNVDTSVKQTIKKIKSKKVEPKTSSKKKIYSGKNGKLSSSELKSIGGGNMLSPAAADSFIRMEKAANAAGIQFNVTDSYRTYEEQDAGFDWDLYNQTGQKKKKGTGGSIAMALPGTSNHGLGNAIDVYPSSAQDWIRKNGEQYGWSWDEGRQVGESWHFTYEAELDKSTADDTTEEPTTWNKLTNIVKDILPK